MISNKQKLVEFTKKCIDEGVQVEFLTFWISDSIAEGIHGICQNWALDVKIYALILNSKLSHFLHLCEGKKEVVPTLEKQNSSAKKLTPKNEKNELDVDCCYASFSEVF